MNKLIFALPALLAFSLPANALDNPDSTTPVSLSASITLGVTCDAKSYATAPKVKFYLSKVPNVIDIKNDTQLSTGTAMLQYDGIDKALQGIIDNGGTFIGNNPVSQYKYQYSTKLTVPGTYTYYDTCNDQIESSVTFTVK